MSVDLSPGWIRQIIDESNTHSRSAAQRYSRCRGFFWDNDRKCLVSLNLGTVNLTVKTAFCAAPSLEVLDDEPWNLLSWAEEGAAPSAQSVSMDFGSSGMGLATRACAHT